MSKIRIWRHICFGLFAVLVILIFNQVAARDRIIQDISISTAYTSLLFFAIALSIGPINLLLSRPTPLSMYIRRDFGIWAAITAIIHTIAGLQVHLGGKFLHYFIYPPDMPHGIPARHDAFGVTNYLGLACTLIMIVILSLSNNRSIRYLGAAKWKKWQKFSYLLVAAIPVHGLIYQVLEKRVGLYTLSMLSIILVCACFQVSGILKYRKKA